MSFEVGDKVMVRPAIKDVDGLDVVAPMKTYCGRLATIKRKRKNEGPWGDSYFLDIDNGDWIWCKGMLEEISTNVPVVSVEGLTEEEVDRALKAFYQGRNFTTELSERPRTMKDVEYDIAKQLNKFMQSGGRYLERRVINDYTVICYQKDGISGVGVAKCSPKDEYIETVGYFLAVCRALKLIKLEQEYLTFI